MNKKLRYYFWIVEGYIKKHFLKAVIFLGAFIVAFVALYTALPYLFRPQQDVFYEGMVGRYTLKTLPPQVLEYISYGLVKIDDSGNPVPDAAESISEDPDGKRFIVKLKNNIKWHDGTPLTSNDLAYQLADVAVTRPDSSTLVFTLKDSYAPFPTLLSGSLIKITSNNVPQGIGSYRITDVNYRQSQAISSLTLEASSQKPHKVVINFYPTEKDAETAFKLGQISGLRLGQSEDLNSWNNATIYQKVMPRRFVGLFFQMKDPLLGGKDSSLRKALSAAINDIPNEQPFTGPLPSNSWAEVPADGKRYDLDKAKQLLEKYKTANKGNSNKLEIKLSTLAVYKSTAEYVAKAWTDLGVPTTVEVVDKLPETFQVLLTAQELPADPDQYALWHSTQKQTNITGYNNLRVDKDLEDARKTVDQRVRKDKYADFQKQLREDTPIIYLYQPYFRYLILNKDNKADIRKFKGLNG